jgi:hypothetical protein
MPSAGPSAWPWPMVSARAASTVRVTGVSALMARYLMSSVSPSPVVSVHAGLPRPRRQQRREDAHEGRLARAVGPEQAEHHPGGHVELEAVERSHVPEALAQVAHLDCCR